MVTTTTHQGGQLASDDRDQPVDSGRSQSEPDLNTSLAAGLRCTAHAGLSPDIVYARPACIPIRLTGLHRRRGAGRPGVFVISASPPWLQVHRADGSHRSRSGHGKPPSHDLTRFHWPLRVTAAEKNEVDGMSEQSLQERFSAAAFASAAPAKRPGLRIRSLPQGTSGAEWTPAPHHQAFPGALNGASSAPCSIATATGRLPGT